jgi:hypothetical protein
MTPQERAIVGADLASGLKDPAAAQFRWNRIGAPDDKGRAEYCAMINGKNSYGGYNGFQPFMGFVFFQNGKIVGAKMVAIGDDAGGALAVVQDCRAYGMDPAAAT